MAEYKSIIEKMATFENFTASNRFEAIIEFPTIVGINPKEAEKVKLLLKAATIPTETIEEIPIKYMGHTFKVAGDRVYEDWTSTIYSTEDWSIRNNIEKWMKIINDIESGLKSPHSSYLGDIKIKQLGINTLEPIAVYNLVGAWPSVVGEITLDWESENEVQTFDVTWKYQYVTRL